MKWHKRYYRLAKEVSTWSKDPNTQVGAVITNNNYVIGLGFNGFPKGVKDDLRLLSNRNLKNKLMIHAEQNAINAAECKGDSIYVYPCLPCTRCIGEIIQVGIKTIVTGPINPNSRWDQDLVLDIIKEVGISLIIMEGDK